MATRRLSPTNSNSSPEDDHGEKGLYDDKSYGYNQHEFPAEHHGHIRGLETEAGHSLHRGLKARHITMIAIGGAIGTGLIIGTGSGLANAGPGSIFLAYLIIGFVVYLVMSALGELAAWIPMSAGFTGFATRYCHPSLGFALGWTYWMKYVIATPNQLTASALVIQFWCPREKANPGIFIAVFLIAIVAINMLGIKFFGEFEFWLSSFKVLTIVGVILLSLILASGGGPTGDAPGFRYWKNPGAFRERFAKGDLGRFLGFWSVFTNAVFAYLGTELVGVTAAEAQNPRRTVPKAVKLTFYRILFFYVLSALLVGLLVPYNSKQLAFATSATTGANASPFVVAIKLSGIKALPSIMNACILLFVFSAASSELYIASRTLYALASDGSAPRVFTKTDKRGVPYYATAAAVVICLIAFLNVKDDSKQVFTYFSSLVTILGLMSWISILVTHIYFVRARRAQNLTNDRMAYVAPLGIWGSYAALFICVLVAITKNFDVFIHNKAKYGNFDHKSFITGYLGIPIFLVFLFGHMFYTKSKGVKPHECDLFTGKDIIDREEEEFLARKAEEEAASGRKKGLAWFYSRFVAWLF